MAKRPLLFAHCSTAYKRAQSLDNIIKRHGFVDSSSEKRFCALKKCVPSKWLHLCADRCSSCCWCWWAALAVVFDPLPVFRIWPEVLILMHWELCKMPMNLWVTFSNGKSSAPADWNPCKYTIDMSWTLMSGEFCSTLMRWCVMLKKTSQKPQNSPRNVDLTSIHFQTI